MSTARDKAMTILRAIPDRAIRSNDASGDYQRFTGGLQHATMAANWAKGGIMTGCNAFVGWYGSQLGSKSYLGRFDLNTYLPTQNLGHTWVRSAPGKRPQAGDILLHAGLHIDVAMGFDGDVLLRIAAGQGGKGMGADVLTRVRGKGPFNAANLQGWIDIDALLGPAPAPAPPCTWLHGWWSVWDGNQYYYFFRPDSTVQYVKTRPGSSMAPVKGALNSGGYKLGADGTLVIDWNPADGGATQETFRGARAGALKFNGTSNRYAPLVASRM